jgi:hypothetical protein
MTEGSCRRLTSEKPDPILRGDFTSPFMFPGIVYCRSFDGDRGPPIPHVKLSMPTTNISHLMSVGRGAF